MAEQPPILDITGLSDGAPDALRRVAAALPAPCARWGVFHVAGHGIAPEELRAFDAAMRAFFELPSDVKARVRRTRTNARGYYDEELTKNRPDWKEVFDYGAERADHDADARHSDGTNQWPEEAPALRAPLLRWYEHCVRISGGLLRALCASLGLSPGTLDAAFARHTSFVRLNRYRANPDAAPADAPLFPEAGKLGVHHHTDAGAFTIVYQDDVPGLQLVQPEGEANLVVQPVPGALTVNLGDLLQVCSNDRYRSPLHRVIVDPQRTRHSAPFFFNPSYATTYQPLALLLGQGETPRYRSIAWAHFRDQRSAGDFADYGAEIQISDFRIRG